MKTATATLASALRILADEIESDDNVPALCLMEAADRLESLATELGWGHWRETRPKLN